MAKTPPPFAPFEWMIAWRYLRAKRADGGVSVMTWISLVGITLAVFALVATLAVRAGFRTEFVNTILGANAHVTVYYTEWVDENGQATRVLPDHDEMAARVAEVPGITRVAPLVKGQVMATANNRNAGVEVFGIAEIDLKAIPSVADPEKRRGDLDEFANGIAIGSGVAMTLGVGLGDQVKLISPNGVKTAFGVSPRVKSYEVTYIFSAGRYDIDRTRVYMPFEEAQLYFNREGAADELEVTVANPENVESYTQAIGMAAGPGALIWSWQDASGAALQAIAMQDDALFILLAILILIATMNITSGLIMLVKNKGGDIGILRTMGLTEGSILRIFLIVGASIGVIGTVLGVLLGILFAMNIESIYGIVDVITGSNRASLENQGFFFPPAEVRLPDLARTVLLSLILSFVVTIFPARRAARLNPVEALRYE
ncbi:lipoprotein-releasing ABC transporter permease subunit [Tropicibacter sp. S64]|uniref:lipoprotein-releasing ABC transporter permease subunit n=1 Tax=Tropicibacter sp. S64 TaxID=3415122 RepID=UPI003C7A5AA7